MAKYLRWDNRKMWTFIDVQPNKLARDLCLMEDVEMQVLTYFDSLLEKVDNIQMNELCFDRLNGTFKLPITMEKLYLNIHELENDSDWINEVNKSLLITSRERFRSVI